jgi:hypothetical protein
LRSGSPPRPLAAVNVDYLFRGAAATVGLTYAPLDWLELAVAGVLGPRWGVRAWVQCYPLRRTRWKPFLTAGAPIFFVDGGTYAGVHGGVGVIFEVGRHLGLLTEAAVEHVPGLPPPLADTYFFPSLGLQARW